MANVYFKNEYKNIEVESGTSLIECIRLAGLKIETPCNCIGICGKCKVIAKGSLSPICEEEKAFINKKNERLACLTKVGDGYVEVELINLEDKMKTINKGHSIEVDINSSISKIKLPKMEDELSIPYINRLGYMDPSLNVINKFSKMDSINNNYYGIKYEDKIIDIKSKSNKIYGVSFDIGTTGLSAYLVNLETGNIQKKISGVNPQTEFGGDVLSRITYCKNDDNKLNELKETIINKINSMIKELIKDILDIYMVMITGNTIMLHLLAGISPYSIAKAPYRPVFTDSLVIRPKEINIEINDNGIVRLLPSASGYIGADITSGVIATGFNHKNHSAIFVDIGTNGEIVAIKDKKLAATSTAAGPALEGMNITKGCRAISGAIDSFSIDEDYKMNYTTINDKEAIGICGSGLIDIIAELVDKKVVLKSGRFNKRMPDSLKERLKDKSFYLTENIYVTQGDIRQVQLAKGAIGTGIKMLIEEINLGIQEIDEVVIAGSFGYHVNPINIKKIGLIPKELDCEINFVGNSAIEGARLALINDEILKDIINISKKIRVLELSKEEKFQNYFVRELSF